jgi:hypothetical protein
MAKKILHVRTNFDTCLDCKAFQVEPGEDGYYPGEYTPIRISCAKQIWHLDNEDDQETLVRYFRTAIDCPEFEPVNPVHELDD